ncbi:MAG: enoyl-CoA hydratase/isomerase family protein [Planctomycetota bacterium]|nr:enoyl-CoA hydratase/isomerase family protein [Planctomycetota bacterium]
MTPDSLKIDTEQDGVVTLWLSVHPERARGGVVVLDNWLIGAIAEAMEKIHSGPTPSGFVLRSASDRVFVAGADLAEIDALDDPDLHAYLERGAHAFGLISTLDCPSVAIVHKAALGGGLEIAMHCDAIIAVARASDEKPWRIGLPECALGICPGWGGSQCLPARINPETSLRAIASGTTWAIDNVPSGLFDSVGLAGADPMILAREWISKNRHSIVKKTHPRSIGDAANKTSAAKALTAVRTEISSSEHGFAIADAVDSGLKNGWQAGCASERSHLVALRHTQAARSKLDAFLKKG